MLKNNLRFNRRGFTLVETMVSVAVMTVVILGVLQILGTQLRVSNTARIDADISNTVFLVSSLLKNSNGCKENINNFGAKKVSLPATATEKLAVTSLDYPMSGGKLLKVGTTPATQSAAVVKGMYLSGFKLLSNTGGYNIISSELNIEFGKPNAVGAQVTNRKVAVQLRADTSGNILDCSGEGTELTTFQLESICLSNGGSFDFPTKKCTLPTPPPVIVQMPVPVPVPVMMASASGGAGNPASAAGNGGFGGGGNTAVASNTSNARPIASVAAPQPQPQPQPQIVAQAPVPAPQPIYVPPPVVVAAPAPRGPQLYLVAPGCLGAGGVTTAPTCRTIIAVQETNGAGYLACDGAYYFDGTSQICSNSPL